MSTAIPADDARSSLPRASWALPIIHRGELLAEVGALRRLIAVAGTHGKTTTAAMAAHALARLRRSTRLPDRRRAARRREGAAANAPGATGGWLVAEADESDRSFLELAPEIAVVTNVELDHHTTYGSLVELEQAFR